ncbi:MAG: hypothetical protein RJB66_166 [Pseudomonadota bacterium]|jgi:rare lipoprotein A (peptidoglycan hydrolase)
MGKRMASWLFVMCLAQSASATMNAAAGEPRPLLSEVGSSQGEEDFAYDAAAFVPQNQSLSYRAHQQKRADNKAPSEKTPVTINVIPLDEWNKMNHAQLSLLPKASLERNGDQLLNTLAFEKELERVSGSLRDDEQLASLRKTKISGKNRRGRKSQVLTCAGDATYYLPTGKRTASGDRFTGRELSAAAVSRFPLNSILVVCRQDKVQTCVKVKANDRGGFEHQRGNPTLVDLSPAAASYLGFGPRAKSRDDEGGVIGRVKITVRGPGC